MASCRLLLLLATVVAAAGGGRERPPPMPLGCSSAYLPAEQPESALSRLMEHVCVARPQMEVQFEPRLEVQFEPRLEAQFEPRLELWTEHRDAETGRPAQLPQTPPLRTPDGLLERHGPTGRLRYRTDDQSVWLGADSDGRTQAWFDWHGWIAPTQDQVPGELCRNHSRAYVRELLRPTTASPALWALRMADASGKLPDGLLYGNTNLLGSWDGCRAVRARLNASEHPAVDELRFSGQMCSAVITPADNSSDGLALVPALPVLARAGLTPPAVRYAYCVPSSCGAEDVRVSLQAALGQSGLVAAVSDCHTEGESAQLDAGDWALVAFLALTAALLLVCTVLDVAVSHGLRLRPWRDDPLPVYRGSGLPPRRPHLLVRAFSLYEHVPRLMSTASDERTIGCLHGLRCLTMAWIILGHIYVVGFYVLPCSNLAVLPELIAPLPFQLVMNAYPAVDTFLVISGVLLALGLARQQTAGRPVGLRQLPALYLHRFLRLTPLYAVVVWFTATLLRHIGSGMFTKVNFAMFGVTGCRTSWWHNLLYINNFFPNDETVCIDQSWYLGLDMQLFLVGPLLVLPALRWPRAGAVLLAAAAVISVIIPGVITYVLDLPPALLNVNVHATDPAVMSDFTLLVYNAPWSRAAPYVVGLALGLLLGGVWPAPRLSRPVCGLLWTLSTAGALLVLLGMWRYNSQPDASWTPAVAVSYAALHRPAWALCVGWVIWACASGRGGPVDALLSHAVWRPLSRLTYATYLTSIQLMVWYASLQRQPIAAGHLAALYWFLADLAVNVAVAAVFSLAFEWPTATLEKALREWSSRAAATPRH